MKVENWSIDKVNRLHHRVDWNATAPKILIEDYKR